jgi:nucleoside-diphosphate-sugar epimerase
MSIKGALITGGAGFLGSHITEHLLREGIPCIAIDNLCTGRLSNLDFTKGLSTDFLYIEADGSEPWTQKIHPALKDWKHPISHVFHFASPASPPLYQEMAFQTMDINTKGLEEAIRFADARSARVIFASTSETYGDPEVHPQPESYRGNVNTMGIRACYDEAKRFGETIIYTHNWKNGTNHGLVRIFNTYGPRMNPADGRVVINFLVQGHKGEDLTVYGDGSQTRSFCYVDDLVDGILKYAETNITDPVNLGNDKEFTILELAESVQSMFSEKKIGIRHLELPKDDPTKRRPELKRAKSLLSPWEPKVPLNEGLKHMYSWLKEAEILG